MGLTFIFSMSKSLLLTQLFLVLKYAADKYLRYMAFWLGDLLYDLITDPNSSPHSVLFPAFFQSLAVVVADAKMAHIFSANNWRGLINKMVYTRNIDLLPAPNIELDAGYPMTDVWERAPKSQKLSQN